MPPQAQGRVLTLLPPALGEESLLGASALGCKRQVAAGDTESLPWAGEHRDAKPRSKGKPRPSTQGQSHGVMWMGPEQLPQVLRQAGLTGSSMRTERSP